MFAWQDGYYKSLGLVDFLNLIHGIVNAMEELSTSGNYNRDTEVKSAAFLHAIMNFEFITALVITKNILIYGTNKV